MTGPAHSIVDSVLPRRQRLRLARRDAQSAFAGAVKPALRELMAAPVTASTLARFNRRQAAAVAAYRLAIGAPPPVAAVILPWSKRRRRAEGTLSLIR